MFEGGGWIVLKRYPVYRICTQYIPSATQYIGFIVEEEFGVKYVPEQFETVLLVRCLAMAGRGWRCGGEEGSCSTPQVELRR